MNPFSKQVMVLTWLLTGGNTVMADTIDTSGQEPYEQCGYCHEYDGNSVMPMYPRLAGQQPDYLIKQLKDFRSGKREGQMQATAELLSDSDIKVVAQYFSSQPISLKVDDSIAKEDAERAKQLVFSGDMERGIAPCVSCHQDTAKGAGQYPRLSGQHADYLQDQLLAFKNGERHNDPGAVMRAISRQLTDTEIKALSVFLQQIPHQPPVMNKTGRASNAL